MIKIWFYSVNHCNNWYCISFAKLHTLMLLHYITLCEIHYMSKKHSMNVSCVTCLKWDVKGICLSRRQAMRGTLQKLVPGNKLFCKKKKTCLCMHACVCVCEMECLSVFFKSFDHRFKVDILQRSYQWLHLVSVITLSKTKFLIKFLWWILMSENFSLH